MKIKINKRNSLFFIVFFTPFIDVINAIMHVMGNDGVSFGQIVRIFILIVMLYEITIINRKSFLYILLFIIVLILRSLIYALFFDANIYQNLSCDLRYVYVLTFGCFLMSLVNQSQICRSDIFYLLKIYTGLVAILSLIPIIAGVGIDYAGTKRIFTEVNALTAILVIGIGVYLYQLFFENHSVKTILVTLIVIFATISQATKTGIIGLIVLGIYLCIYTGVVRKKMLKQLIIVIIAIIAAMMIYNYFLQGSGNEILNRWTYFYTKMDLWSFLLSGRDEMLIVSFNVWKSNPIYILFGSGFSNMQRDIYMINSTQSYIGAEMDFFDIFFYYGLFVGIGVLIVFGKQIWSCMKYITKSAKESYFGFLFIIIFLISFLGAHVLSSPLAGILLCMMFGITKK